MNKKYPFQYAILQYVHDAFTEEFLNVGLALYSQNPPYFQTRLLTKYARVTNTFPTADGEQFRRYVTSLQTKFDAEMDKINSGQPSFDGWPPATMDEILSKVLPVDDSALRFGPTHGGMTKDLNEIFEDLYYRFVETYLPIDKEEGRSAEIIWRQFSQSLKENQVFQHYFHKRAIQTPRDAVEIDHTWENGHIKGIQPVSFDLMQVQTIRRKSHQWFTANLFLKDAQEVEKIFYILSQPSRDDKELFRAYIKAKDLIGAQEFGKKVEIIEEKEAESFAQYIAPIIIKDTSHDQNK